MRRFEVLMHTKISNVNLIMLLKTIEVIEIVLGLKTAPQEAKLKEKEEMCLPIKEYDLSEDQKRSVNSNTSDNTHSYRTEDLHIPKTLQDEDLQTSDELNASTLPPFEGTQGINSFLQNAFQTLIPQMFMVLKSVGPVVILMVILTQAPCKGVQVPITCTSAAVMTSTNYPSTYPQYDNIDWFVTAPEGRMILLTFHNFSLGPLGDLEVIDTVDGGKGQIYDGKERTIPPFLSTRNSLLLRFTSGGTPTGNGFNISASCYDLSGTRVGRLTGGHTPAEGFLELQAESGDEWMRVCEEHSAERLAEVVCRELGYRGAKEVSYEEGGCSFEGTDPGCTRALSCEKYAYRSQDCSVSSEKCALSSLAVKVKCFEPGYKGCYDLGNAQLQNGSSYDSTSQCITSCRAEDTSQAIAIFKGSECFCSTTIDVEQMEVSQSCALHQLVYNATVGFCDELDDVFYGSWDSQITWFGSIVHLTCDDGYRLNGHGTLQCLTDVSSYIHVWNGSIPRCEMVTESLNKQTDIDTSTSLSIKRDSAHIPTPSFVTAFLFSILCVLL